MSAAYPKITNKQAEPNSVTVHLDQNLDAVVGIDRAFVTSMLPSNKFAELKAAIGTLTPVLVKHRPIEQFTRIGLRLMYHKSFPDRDAATKYLLKAVALPLPSGKVMNIEGRLLDPSFAFRWEGETLGFQLRLAAVQSQISVDFPPEYAHLTPQTDQLLLNRVMVDIDYYSHALVSVDQLKAEDLIENWLHVIKRDIAHVVKD